MYTISAMSEIFQLKSSSVSLVQRDSLHDEPLFISRHMSQENVELRLQAVAETDPSRWYVRLLRGRRYKEALVYAEQHDLDVSEVWKAQARDIVDKMACGKSDIDELLRLLDMIKSCEFKVECCQDVHSSCKELKDVKRVLEYGCDMVHIFCLFVCDVQTCGLFIPKPIRVSLYPFSNDFVVYFHYVYPFPTCHSQSTTDAILIGGAFQIC